MKKKEFVNSFEGASDKTLKKRKREGFLKKLKNKIDELFESENLTFLGKILMLSIYGVVSSIGLIVASSIGSGLVKILWVFFKFYGEYPSLFGAICGIGWLLFILSFIVIVLLAIAEFIIKESNDWDDSISIFELPPEES